MSTQQMICKSQGKIAMHFELKVLCECSHLVLAPLNILPGLVLKSPLLHHLYTRIPSSFFFFFTARSL